MCGPTRFWEREDCCEALRWRANGSGRVGRAIFVTGRLPGILMRQIAMAGCDARKLSFACDSADLATRLCQFAKNEQCPWIVTDETNPNLIQDITKSGIQGPKLLVLGGDRRSSSCFATGCDPSFALIRKNLNSVGPARIQRRRQPKRCLLDLSNLASEPSAMMIRKICKKFSGSGIVFDVVTPYAASAAEQLYQQDSPIREYMFWHRNPDRAFQALYAFHLAVMTDAANFYETAFAGIASLMLSADATHSTLPADLTSTPWLIDRRQPD